MTKPFITLLCATLALSGCQKEPGEGGKAEIRGKIYVVEYNDNTGLPTGNEYFAPDARVFIIYGDHDYHDDDIRTGPDGLYVFSWLRKGRYTIFTYSECPTCPGRQEARSVTVEIKDRKEVLEVPTITVEDWR
jgi:hypothetical protein